MNVGFVGSVGNLRGRP